MSHNLRQMENGEAAFTFNRNNGPAWHRLGIPMEGELDWRRALPLIEGDFTVVAEPLFDVLGNISVTHKQTVWYDTAGLRHVLGTVGVGYCILQNAVWCDVLDRLGHDAGFAWDTLGVLGDGSIIFGALEPPKGFELLLANGEKIRCYLVGINGHNGQIIVEFYLTGTRTVCQNTVFAGRSAAVTHWAGRHTPGLEERVKEIQQELQIDPATIARFRAQCDKLIALPADSSVTKAWLETLWPLDGVDHAATRTKRLRVRDLVTSLAEHGRGNDGKSLWSWYNGFTEWADGKEPVRKGSPITLLNSAQADRMDTALSAEERSWRGARLVSNLKGAAQANREAARIGLLELAGVNVAELDGAAMAPFAAQTIGGDQ